MADKSKSLMPIDIDSVYATTSASGSIQIAENVFASIIRNCTLELPDVMKFASAGIVGSLVEMIGKRNNQKPILVDFDENDQVTVTVNVILKFGCHVPTVAEKIQHVISKKVEELTGKEVVRVNVCVIDLVHESTKEQEE